VIGVATATGPPGLGGRRPPRHDLCFRNRATERNRKICSFASPPPNRLSSSQTTTTHVRKVC